MESVQTVETCIAEAETETPGCTRRCFGGWGMTGESTEKVGKKPLTRFTMVFFQLYSPA